MPTDSTLAVAIKGRRDDGETVETKGGLRLVEYDKGDRTRRAAKAWIISWALAVASLPIIIAHWVLVPGFLIAGPFMARRYYRIERSAKSVNGPCPVCGEECAIELEGNETLPLWSYCKPNRDPVQVVAMEDVAGGPAGESS